MGVAIGEVLPLALVAGSSPIPIVAVILLLFSARAKTLGPVFIIGWLLGLAIVGGLVLLLADPAGVEDDADGPSTVVAVIRLALGVLLLFLAYRNWQKRPKPGETPALPKWMEQIDSFTPVKALGTGTFLSGINPKNLALTIAAAVAIAQLSLPPGEEIGALVIYIVIASLGVVVPVVWYLVAPQRAAGTLAGWRVWLVAHNALVMAIMLLIFGVVLIGQGISGLSA